MASTSTEPASAGPGAGGGSGGAGGGDVVYERRGLPPLRGEDGLLSRVLALREGSIIVVTVVVAIYFALNTSSFFTSANFKTLLPYFPPFAILGAGEVFVMILAESAPSTGGPSLPAPSLFYKLSAPAGLPLVPAVIVALI